MTDRITYHWQPWPTVEADALLNPGAFYLRSADFDFPDTGFTTWLADQATWLTRWPGEGRMPVHILLDECATAAAADVIFEREVMGQSIMLGKARYIDGAFAEWLAAPDDSVEGEITKAMAAALPESLRASGAQPLGDGEFLALPDLRASSSVIADGQRSWHRRVGHAVWRALEMDPIATVDGEVRAHRAQIITQVPWMEPGPGLLAWNDDVVRYWPVGDPALDQPVYLDSVDPILAEFIARIVEDGRTA